MFQIVRLMDEQQSISLSEIILSERVCSLGDEAFWECRNLEKVYIPDSVVAIGEHVFVGCDHIKDILMPVGKKELYKDIFESGSIIEVEDHLSTIKADKEGHIYVDLGLSVYWSLYNIGVSKKNSGGDYYGWGVVETPDNLDSMNWAYYKYSKIDGSSDEVLLTKYCNQTSKGANNFVDNKTILDLIDDAANVNWGNNWRIPTKDDFDELLNEKNCVWIWTKLNGMYGYKVISRKKCCEGNWVFFPAAGARIGMGYDRVGISGYYWTSSLYVSGPINAVMLSFDCNYHNLGYGNRYTGLPIRPVLPKN